LVLNRNYSQKKAVGSRPLYRPTRVKSTDEVFPGINSRWVNRLAQRCSAGTSLVEINLLKH